MHRKKAARTAVIGVIAVLALALPAVSKGVLAQRSLGDGAWSWFADPRAVHYEKAHRETYIGWVAQDGDIKVAAFDHDSGIRTTAVLHSRFQIDDHANPALLVRPDGRIEVFYAMHDGDRMYHRVTKNPEDITSWEQEQTISTDTYGSKGFTYPNPIRLSAEAKTYLFWRGGNYNPTFSTRPDGQTAWAPARNLIMVSGERPYVKYDSRTGDTIGFAFTNAHPNEASDVNIYYAYYRNGGIYKANGTRIASLGTAIAAGQADKVFDNQDKVWVHDMAFDSQGRPVIVFADFVSTTDHRYRYAKWTGSGWVSHQITPAGGSISLDGKEPYYSAGITLDHENPNTVYLSRNVGGTFEVETWTTPDDGTTWSRTTVTANSTTNNYRPISPRGLIPFSGDMSVVWMRGLYQSYFTYKTSITAASANGASKPPIADADWSPHQGPAPHIVSFNGTGSSDPDGTVTNWSWNFGDGSSGSGSRPQHTYTKTGRYFPKLTVTDNSGARDVFVGEVVVGMTPYRDAVVGTGSLAGYWRLGEQGGSLASNDAGTGLGNYLGHFKLRYPGALAGDTNTSVYFDGVDSEMSAPGPALPRTSGSLEGWFYWKVGPALMRDNTSTGDAGWVLAYDNGGSLHYRLGGTSFNTGLATASIKYGWHHFVATKDGGNVAFYLDGQRKHSGTGAGNVAPAMPWHVMRNGGYAQFTLGRGDEIAIYNLALSPATVLQHYNAGKSP
jgi:BNR repeat-containing family member/PKD domain/Concanavalin A-like lectin/glucanases superfamily